MKFYLALWFAKLMGIAINLVSKDRGTNLPGEKALTIDPDFVKHPHFKRKWKKDCLESGGRQFIGRNCHDFGQRSQFVGETQGRLLCF
jgi:hypothetical protein